MRIGEVLTMAEYIKKEDIEQKIQDGLNNLGLGHDAIEVLGMIYEMPAADVVTVRHARWEKVAWWQHKNHYECNECSVCGCRVKPKFTYNYCPNCGCRMDGDNDD